MSLFTLMAMLALSLFSHAFVPSTSSNIIPNYRNTTQYQQITTRDVAAGPRLAMAIDTTGSMGGYIAALRTEVRRIVTGRIGTLDAPSLLVLSPFHDPGAGPVTSASDPIDFLAALDTLSASGGGDCPEQSLSGALAALNRLSEGGTLIVVTDASAKDANRKDEVIAAALLKRVKIVFFLFDNICGTGEPAYADIAMATRGQVLTGLTVVDAPKVATLVDVIIKRNLTEFARIAHTQNEPLVNLTAVGEPAARRVSSESITSRDLLVKRAPFAATVILPVDTSVSSIVLTIDGGRNVTVTRPDGNVISGADANARLLTLSRGVIVVLTAPIPGAWMVSITDCDACSVSISGQASVYFDSWFLNESRDGAPIEDPFAGCPYWAVAGVLGDARDIFVEFKKPNGQPIISFPLTAAPPSPGSRFYYGEVIIPNEQYQIYLRADDGTLRIVTGVRTPRAGPCPAGAIPSGSFSVVPSVVPSSTSSAGVISSTPASTPASSAASSAIVSFPPPVNGTTLDSASAGATATSPSSDTSVSDITASPIAASICPTSTIVETKYIFAQCRGKAPCATTHTWDPCPDPPCLATPAPVTVVAPYGKPACAGAAPCGKPGCADVEQNYAPDTVTSV
jgi:hypothetical protein